MAYLLRHHHDHHHDDMHFLSPKYIVKKRSSSSLTMETNSGRSWFLFVVVFFLLFQIDNIKYPGIILCFIVWTYSKEWILNTAENEIKYIKRIIWINYEQESFSIDNIGEVRIDKVTGAEGLPLYALKMSMKSGGEIVITKRGLCSLLKPIIYDIKIFLPVNIKYVFHKDCQNNSKFIIF